MKGGADPPDGLRDLDAALRAVRFQPRVSLLPEVMGRLRRGEQFNGVAPLRSSRPVLLAIAVGVIAVLGASLWVAQRSQGITVDRCCYDFDGGGTFDDGVLVVTRGGAAVRRIAVYEDRDHSRSLTPGDVVRYDRGATLIVGDTMISGLVTTRHCCTDYDGGGPADDGLVVVAVPPDRVAMVALYETPPAGSSAPFYRLR